MSGYDGDILTFQTDLTDASSYRIMSSGYPNAYNLHFYLHVSIEKTNHKIKGNHKWELATKEKTLAASSILDFKV